MAGFSVTGSPAHSLEGKKIYLDVSSLFCFFFVPAPPSGNR